MRAVAFLAAGLVAYAGLFLALALAQGTGADAEIAGAVAAACREQSLIVSALTYGLGGVGGFAILANFRTRLPGPAVAIVDFLGANWSALLRAAMDGAKKTPVLLVVLAAAVSACAGTTGQPLTPAQAQANAETAGYYLKAAGCVAEDLSQVAAPIVSIAGDAEGNQVLSAAGQSAGKLCTVTVPAQALPAPAAPNAPPAIVAPATPTS